MNHPELVHGLELLPCAIRDGMLYIPHADGNWVSAAKLQPFSLKIIEYWRAEQVEASRSRAASEPGDRAVVGEASELLADVPSDPTLTAHLQKMCSDWGTYWRASDAHGVILSPDQAVELLQDALGVEVEIKIPETRPLDDPKLQAMFSDAIEGALAFGFQQNNRPPEGHWLTRFWNVGDAEAKQRADRYAEGYRRGRYFGALAPTHSPAPSSAPQPAASPVAAEGQKAVTEWEHLKRYGYAQGNYLCKCHTCGKVAEFVDKRATTCRPCAEERHTASMADAAEAVARVEMLTGSLRHIAWLKEMPPVGTLLYPPGPRGENAGGVVDQERLAINPTHEAADAFWSYWRENGETHKHGYYESTWGAINCALRAAGIREHNYGDRATDRGLRIAEKGDAS